MYTGFHEKCRLFWLDFNATWTFSPYFRNTFKCQISWKSVPFVVELLLADGRTGITKPIDFFLETAIAP